MHLKSFGHPILRRPHTHRQICCEGRLRPTANIRSGKSPCRLTHQHGTQHRETWARQCLSRPTVCCCRAAASRTKVLGLKMMHDGGACVCCCKEVVPESKRKPGSDQCNAKLSSWQQLEVATSNASPHLVASKQVLRCGLEARCPLLSRAATTCAAAGCLCEAEHSQVTSDSWQGRHAAIHSSAIRHHETAHQGLCPHSLTAGAPCSFQCKVTATTPAKKATLPAICALRVCSEAMRRKACLKSSMKQGVAHQPLTQRLPP